MARLVVPGALVSAEAANVAVLGSALPGATVATRVPKTGTGQLVFPPLMVRVTRTGGVLLSPVHDRPMVLVECWAERDVDAERLAANARAVLAGLWDEPAGGVFVSHRSEIAGLTNFPDPDTTRPRYQFVHEQIIKAATTGM